MYQNEIHQLPVQPAAATTGTETKYESADEIIARAEARFFELSARYAALFDNLPQQAEEIPFWQWMERQLESEGLLQPGTKLFVTALYTLWLLAIVNTATAQEFLL